MGGFQLSTCPARDTLQGENSTGAQNIDNQLQGRVTTKFSFVISGV